MALIREPDGVDLVVAEGHPDRQTQLETAEWLNKYRRAHDQSSDLLQALKTIQKANRFRQASKIK